MAAAPAAAAAAAAGRQQLATAADLDSFLAKYDTFLLDCDGVLWLGNNLIPGVADALARMRAAGKRLLFVTNNSTKARADYLKKFTSLGLQASVDEIFGSSYAAAYYVANQLNFPKDKKVFVCGMKGICDELASEGIQYCGGPDEDERVSDMSHLGDVKPDPQIGAVLFGFDININYTKLAKAFTYIHSNPECHFLATNSDLTYPAAGTVFPGTGALLAALAAPLGPNRQPTVLGKPHQTMLDVIVAKYHLDRHRTCMIGDRLDTDIEFGKLGGLSTLLVMTGVTSEKELAASAVVPDYVVDSLGLLGTLTQ
ncbi:HAD-like domain-containing protein [Entophlyctis helioformis]|nr:HAD-like domain-containing protein [Entophlyctis helioformis]